MRMTDKVKKHCTNYGTPSEAWTMMLRLIPLHYSMHNHQTLPQPQSRRSGLSSSSPETAAMTRVRYSDQQPTTDKTKISANCTHSGSVSRTAWMSCLCRETAIQVAFHHCGATYGYCRRQKSRFPHKPGVAQEYIHPPWIILAPT